jgi:hypothetical protein
MASGVLIRSTATGVVWFLCGLCLSCGQPERNVDENQRPPDPDQDPRFFSELVHIPPGGDSVFLSYLRACRAPEWEDMLGEGAIQEVTLYELPLGGRHHPEVGGARRPLMGLLRQRIVTREGGSPARGMAWLRR